MHAVILAAGCGNRMKPLTDAQHKTLLLIDGKTLIDRLLAGLEAAGVRSLLIVTGYRADEVEAHVLARFARLNPRFVRNVRWAETNNIVSLAMAFEQLDFTSDVILAEADLVCDPSVLKRLVDAPATEAALVDHYGIGMDGTVVTISDEVVTGVIPPHLQGGDFDFRDKFKTLNVYKFSAEFCRSKLAGLLRFYAQSVDSSIYYELVLGILIYLGRARIHAVLVEPGERWAELDDPNDLAVAELRFRKSGRHELLESSQGGWWSHDVLDFCYLRNMYWPTSAMLSELRRNLPQLLHNYGSNQATLDRKLQWWLRVGEGRATVIAGLSQVFPWLKRQLTGRRLLLPTPTFGEYSRHFPDAMTYADHFHVDLADLSARLRRDDICVIVDPNNPTGTTLPTAELHALIETRSDCLFIVDESFQGFTGQPSLVDWLERRPLKNAIVLVSLSKTLGVPGARLGYVYTHSQTWRDSLRNELPIWNLNSIAENLLEIALKYRPQFEDSLGRTRLDRANFAQQLHGLPAVTEVHEGGGNFVTVRLRPKAVPPEGLANYFLDRHSLVVKDVTSRIADGHPWLRLAVRSPAENRLLTDALVQ
jgi:histidinol-phosphate/aromatic aminotransferase/cobyric acid decarboxylase-like protein/CTP:molybdopterin cytidylyltransferase MocA